MLNVRFNVEMAEEVKSMIIPELEHLVTLANAWEGEKLKKQTPKVSIRELLKLKKIGKTTRSNETAKPILIQTKIPNFFKKNAKRNLPGDEKVVNNPTPNKKTKANELDSDVDSQFSEPLLLEKPSESLEEGQEDGDDTQLEDTGVIPGKSALDTTPEDSSNSSSENSEDETGTNGSSEGSDNDPMTPVKAIEPPTSSTASPKVVVDVIKKAEIQQHFVDFFDSNVGSAILNSVSLKFLF